MSYFLRHEPKRLAGVETDSPKVNPQGDQTERRAGHQPSRGIGGEPKRSPDSPPRLYPHACGQTDSQQAARRVNLPSGGRFSNITEDVRKYAAEQAISEEETIQRGMAEKPKEFVEAGAKVCAKA
jgi:hypothetical protein